MATSIIKHLPKFQKIGVLHEIYFENQNNITASFTVNKSGWTSRGIAGYYISNSSTKTPTGGSSFLIFPQISCSDGDGTCTVTVRVSTSDKAAIKAYYDVHVDILWIEN